MAPCVPWRFHRVRHLAKWQIGRAAVQALARDGSPTWRLYENLHRPNA